MQLILGDPESAAEELTTIFVIFLSEYEDEVAFRYETVALVVP